MLVFGILILFGVLPVNHCFFVVGSYSPKESVFDMVWWTKVPKKVMFFILQVLLGWVNSVDRLLVRRRTSLVGPFCYMLCWMAE